MCVCVEGGGEGSHSDRPYGLREMYRLCGEQGRGRGEGQCCDFVVVVGGGVGPGSFLVAFERLENYNNSVVSGTNTGQLYHVHTYLPHLHPGTRW